MHVYTSVHRHEYKVNFLPLSHASMSPCDQDHLSLDLDLEMISHVGVGDAEGSRKEQSWASLKFCSVGGDR